MKHALPHIAWALDTLTGKLIKADRAEHRPGKGRYCCLDDRCGRDLTVARTKQGRQHFRHFRNTHATDCLFHGHTDGRHAAAQRLLAILFSEVLRGRAPMPLFLFDTPKGVREVLPFVHAKTIVQEWRCPLSGRRVDMALLGDNGIPVLLVEIWHTHAIDNEKRKDLRPYWWIEVEANQVLVDTDFLVIRNHDNLPAQLAIAWEQFRLYQ